MDENTISHFPLLRRREGSTECGRVLKEGKGGKKVEKKSGAVVGVVVK